MVDTSKAWEEFLDSANIEDQTILWGESYERYEDNLRKLYEEFTPHGIMEENQINRLAKSIWTRDRIDRNVQFKMNAKQNELRANNLISHLVEKLKPLAPSFLKAKTVKEVEDLLNKFEDPNGKILIQARWPLEKCKTPNAWGTVIAEGLSALVPDKRFEDEEEFFKMVEVFPIDEEFGTLERMDAGIDRTLKRLMQLKTMKQMFRQLDPKQIEQRVVRI
jgi:hypothetical protein